LDGFYEVTFGNTVVGKCEVRSQGLYCRIICRYRIPGDPICHLYAVTEAGRENLGVPVPEGDGFLLDRKIPVKRIGQGDIRFALSAGAGTLTGTFVPIRPEEPFLYIERLQNAFLELSQGQVGIRIQNPRSAQ